MVSTSGNKGFWSELISLYRNLSVSWHVKIYATKKLKIKMLKHTKLWSEEFKKLIHMQIEKP
jgi:hypothetical protein